VVAAAERPGAHDEDRSKDPLIRRALRGEVASGIVLSGNGPVIKAAAPIHYNENQLLGTITSGIALDVSLLARIKKLSNTDLVITDLNGRAITSTLPESGGADGTYLAQTFPLHDPAGGEIVRIVVLQEDRLPRILAKAHMTLLLLLSGIAALSIFILFLILKRVMRPVVRLKEGAERIGKGDFSHRIEVTSHDEIGGLSESFNTMARDLELLRSMEERLAQSERLAAVGRFAAGIAHEINNPIGNVIGLAKLMLRTATDDATREDLETIVNNASRCARITRDLLAYSRQSPPGKEPASLPALIDDAVNAVRRRGDSRKLEVLTEYHAGLPKVMIDSLQISQVLNNILLNAVQAVDSTGMIRISALPDGLAWVRIDISDTGCGIDDKIKDKIFYPFFTTKKDGEGTGLGLAISYGIIQNHGGEIFVESKKGLGSTFSVRLPVGHARG
jgi:two-component system NtrC family sensor kinase